MVFANISSEIPVFKEMLKITFAQGTWVIFVVFVFTIVLAFLFNKLHQKFQKNADNMDVAFDAGGTASTGLTATTIVAQWTWAATLLQSSAVASKYGVSGPFWYASGATIQILLFALVSVKLKTHAPGAKTFLQVILCRFGTRAHIVYIVYALLTNLIVTAMLMLGGAEVLHSMIEGYSIEMATLMCAMVIGVYTQIGGLGATFYASYFNTVIIFIGILMFSYKTFFSGESQDFPLGSMEKVYTLVQAAAGPEGNTGYSYLAFFSQGGLMFGIINIVGNFGTVFVDQSYYQSSIAAKPKQGVYGFLSGGLVWFAVPFTFATTMGLAYIALGTQERHNLISDNHVSAGLLPVAVVSRFGSGVFMVVLMLMILMAVTSTGSAEVVAIASILVYDIHMVYLKPYRDETHWRICPLCGVEKNKKGHGTKECKCFSMAHCKHCKTDNKERKMIKRGMEPAYTCQSHGKFRLHMDFVKHRKSMCMLISATLTIPVSLILHGFSVTLGWVYLSMGVLIGSAVIPVTLAITWKRVTTEGMIAGPIIGTVAGIVAWLIVASTYPEGLNEFFKNTGNEISMLVGNLVSILVGGLVTIVLSFFTISKVDEADISDTWENTLDIDNPLYSWADAYRKELSAVIGFSSPGRPVHATVVQAFRRFYLVALWGSMGLTVVLVVIWPLVASSVGVFGQSGFKLWVVVAFVWSAVAGVYIATVPVWSEIVVRYRESGLIDTDPTTATRAINIEMEEVVDINE